VLARVPDHIPPTLPVGISEASTTTAPLPPPQMPSLEPHERLIQKRGEIAALKERSRVLRENDRIRRSQDPRLSRSVTEETGEGSTTTPVPALLDESGFPKRTISPAEVAALKKISEARRRKQREEQELQASLATTECDAETAGEGSTRTAQNSTDVGAPPVAATPPPPQASEDGQQSGPTNRNLTELEIALANPNLRPEDKKFAESAKFKNAKKMVPGNATTARYVPASSRGQGTNIVTGNSAPKIGAQCTRMGQKANSNITGKRSTTSRRRYVPLV
jgi:hypothetical protein